CLSPQLRCLYAAVCTSSHGRNFHFSFPRNLKRFHGPAHLPERSTSLSPLLRPLRFPDSIAPARHQRRHRHVNGRLTLDDAAGNRNLLLRPTLLPPRRDVDWDERIGRQACTPVYHTDV